MTLAVLAGASCGSNGVEFELLCKSAVCNLDWLEVLLLLSLLVLILVFVVVSLLLISLCRFGTIWLELNCLHYFFPLVISLLLDCSPPSSDVCWFATSGLNFVVLTVMSLSILLLYVECVWHEIGWSFDALGDSVLSCSTGLDFTRFMGCGVANVCNTWLLFWSSLPKFSSIACFPLMILGSRNSDIIFSVAHVVFAGIIFPFGTHVLFVCCIYFHYCNEFIERILYLLYLFSRW
jgi:hypothetical protein